MSVISNKNMIKLLSEEYDQYKPEVKLYHS